MAKNSKKTIAVKTILDGINRQLHHSNDKLTQVEKAVLCTTLETILFDTKNYNGYNNTYWLETGFNLWLEDGKPDFPKKTEYIGKEYDRVYY